MDKNSVEIDAVEEEEETETVLKYFFIRINLHEKSKKNNVNAVLVY